VASAFNHQLIARIEMFVKATDSNSGLFITSATPMPSRPSSRNLLGRNAYDRVCVSALSLFEYPSVIPTSSRTCRLDPIAALNKGGARMAFSATFKRKLARHLLSVAAAIRVLSSSTLHRCNPLLLGAQSSTLYQPVGNKLH